MRPLLTSFKLFAQSPTFRKETYDAADRAFKRARFTNPEKRLPRYLKWRAETTNGMILHTRTGPATEQYWEPWLLAHVRRHVPNFEFKTEFVTLVQMDMNPITGELEPGRLLEREVERPLLQRERLMQVFTSAGPGTYGFYAARGLKPFTYAVGSFAAAEIDQFFAMIIPIIKQPYGPVVNAGASDLETGYWSTRKAFMEALAGLKKPYGPGKFLRWSVVGTSAFLDGWKQYTSTLPVEERLSEQQMKKIVTELLPLIDQWDANAGKAFAEHAERLFDKMVAENRIESER